MAGAERPNCMEDCEANHLQRLDQETRAVICHPQLVAETTLPTATREQYIFFSPRVIFTALQIIPYPVIEPSANWLMTFCSWECHS